MSFDVGMILDVGTELAGSFNGSGSTGTLNNEKQSSPSGEGSPGGFVNNFQNVAGAVKPSWGKAIGTGAALGGTFGTVVPGIGNAVGAVLGAIGGAASVAFKPNYDKKMESAISENLKRMKENGEYGRKEMGINAHPDNYAAYSPAQLAWIAATMADRLKKDKDLVSKGHETLKRTPKGRFMLTFMKCLDAAMNELSIKAPHLVMEQEKFLSEYKKALGVTNVYAPLTQKQINALNGSGEAAKQSEKGNMPSATSSGGFGMVGLILVGGLLFFKG